MSKSPNRTSPPMEKKPMSRALRTADALIVTVIGGLTVALMLGQVHGVFLHLSAAIWVGGICLMILILRLLVGLLINRHQSATKAVPMQSQASYGELVRSLPTPLSRLVEEAEVIQILGGTMIEFVRQEDSLAALSVAHSRGARIEIILLDPRADVLQVIAEERAKASSASVEAILKRLKGECEFSIERLLAKLPQGAASQVIRLSAAMPHHAFSRFDDTYLFTAYTFARGGDSPSVMLRKTIASDPLCEGLARGFADLWASESVRPPEMLDAAKLQSN
jgi:hypothetical protein